MADKLLTPKEKAKELVDKFSNQTCFNQEYTSIFGVGKTKIIQQVDKAKQCALIAVYEIMNLSVLEITSKSQSLKGFIPTPDYWEYWSDVEREIKKYKL